MPATEPRSSAGRAGRLQQPQATVQVRSEARVAGRLAVRIRFGNRLRFLRLNARIPPCDLAYLLGLSCAHLEDIESGVEDVDLLLLEQLAAVFKMPIAALILGV